MDKLLQCVTDNMKKMAEEVLPVVHKTGVKPGANGREAAAAAAVKPPAPAPAAAAAAVTPPAFDPDTAMGGLVDDYIQGGGVDFSDFGEKVMANPQLKEYYASQLGGTPEAEQISSAAMGGYLDSIKNPQTAADYSRSKAHHLRLSQGPYADQAKRSLPVLQWNQRRRRAAMTPEEHQQDRQSLINQAVPDNVRQLAESGGADVGEMLREGAIKPVAQKEAKMVLEATKALQSDPEATGFMDWIETNWQTLLVPAGIAAFAFGGDVGKVLGAMSIAAGGYNLYERYDRLTNPDNDYNAPISAAISTAAKTGFKNTEEAVKSVCEQFGDPNLAGVVRSGLADYTFVAAQGFMNQIQEGLAAAPDAFTNQFIAPLSQPAPTENVAEGGLMNDIMRRAGSGWDTVSNFVAPGGRR